MKPTVLLLILSLFMLSEANAQYRQKKNRKDFYGNQRLHKPLYKWVTGDYSRHGIQVSFGPTYTLTSNQVFSGEFRPSEDSLIRYNREANGKIGFFGEIGMVHITKRPRKLIHYYDWGIGYRHIAGRETQTARIYDDRDTLIGQLNGEGEFYNGYLSGRFSVHNVFQLNPYLFLDNAIGVNADYGITGGNRTYNGFYNPLNQKFQGDFVAQLNYHIGLGVKPWLDRGFFYIIGCQLPVFGAYEWNQATPAIHWFSSKYFPAQLNIKLIWLFKKDPNRCPPVET